MRKKTQKGGILIKTNPEEAINFFIENCSQIEWLRATETSASGVIFTCTLNDGIESPYEMIRSADFKSPVKKILIKIVGIDSVVHDETDDEYEGERWSIPAFPSLVSKKLEQEETFKKEINIQTDIFLKTISYLNPLCPAPIYASIKKDKTDARQFISKLKIPDKFKTFTNATNRLINGLISNIDDGSIPYLGILGMEIADGYDTFYDFYSMHLHRPRIRIYENMIRLKNLELALKTGYSQGDFHTGNMLVNPSVSGYYAEIPGNALIIDFGYANKMPAEKLQEIKQLVSENKFVEALKIFNTLVRSDNLSLSEYPNFYGWLSYNYDNKENKPIELVNPEDIAEENVKLLALKQAEESATDARVAFYNSDSHSRERDKYPLLPLSNAVKNSLFEGILSGGKKKIKNGSTKRTKRTKRTKKTNKYTKTNNYTTKKTSKSRRHLR
jgi:hypothetical protein